MLQSGDLAVLTSSILLPGDFLYCSENIFRLPLKKRDDGRLRWRRREKLLKHFENLIFLPSFFRSSSASAKNGQKRSQANVAIPLPGRVITTTKCQAGVMVEPVGGRRGKGEVGGLRKKV